MALEIGYLELPYLQEYPYLTVVREEARGLQFEAVIDVTAARAFQQKFIVDTARSFGIQLKGIIENYNRSSGMQLNAVVETDAYRGAQYRSFVETLRQYGSEYTARIDALRYVGSQYEAFVDAEVARANQFNADVLIFKTTGMQFTGTIPTENWYGSQQTAVIESTESIGGQYKSNIIDLPNSRGLQFNAQINDVRGMKGTQFVHGLFHTEVGYSIPDYCNQDNGYNVAEKHVHIPVQFTVFTHIETQKGLQFTSTIETIKYEGTQFLGYLTHQKTRGTQFEAEIVEQVARGEEFLSVIYKNDFVGSQLKGVISKIIPYGMQWKAERAKGVATQFRAVLYNNNNLRILKDYPSRGVNGVNWTASSTETGDFSPNNVNTDIVEQVWRSDNETTCWLICDTQINQGAYIDTFAMLNHNISRAAVVILQGSTSAAFTAIGFEYVFPQIESENIYYISPELPMTGYRYWRIQVLDPTNVNGFIQVGTILFGSSIIFQGECFSNPIKYKRTHYVDTVATEGYTNMSNDRGIKRSIGLDFASLDYNKGNYSQLVDIFEYARTNLKCLWIPTPTYSSRFAVYGKLVELPSEEHTDNGNGNDYVSLSIEVDEAK